MKLGLIVVSVVALASCKKPRGTCILTFKSESQCIIHEMQSACTGGSNATAPDEFFEEDAKAGATRCRSGGFDTDASPSSIEHELSEGGAFIYYKQNGHP
jgi:hypothetical protein